MGKGDRNKAHSSLSIQRLMVEAVRDLSDKISSHESEMDKRFKSLELKVDELRLWKSKMMGVAAGISLAISLAFAVYTHAF